MAEGIFSVDDLRRTFIRAQTAAGRWVSVSLHDATDEQFNVWASSHFAIQGDSEPWSLSERARFCAHLEQHRGELAKVKREMLIELEATDQESDAGQLAQ